MTKKINVAILDDHHSIIDGYLYRLRNYPDIKVVDTATFGEELEPMVAKHKIDVLLLDISVPMSVNNPNPMPVLHLVGKILDRYPDLSILPISMHAERALINAVIDAGASGYIFKDDHASIQNLGRAIHTVADGGMYFSTRAHQLLMQSKRKRSILTARQVEVLNLLATFPHITTKEAANRMSVAPSTVRNLMSDAYIRLGVPNRSAAIIKAQQMKLILNNVSSVDIEQLK